MNPWITAALAAMAAGCIGGLVWHVHFRRPDTPLPRPGSDTQFKAWINDQHRADRAEEGRDG